MEKRENKIAVVDFGGQYAHLISRRIRQLHVYSEITDPDAPAESYRGFKGIILSGGPASVYGKGAPHFNPEILELNIPVLGICYGHQLIAKLLGGKVTRAATHEYGSAEVSAGRDSPLFSGLPSPLKVWMSHGDYVSGLPEGFEVTCSSPECRIAGMGDVKKGIYGIQFHPEVTHTPKGMDILENFVYRVCGCTPEWTIGNFLNRKVAEIKKSVGSRNVFMLASGGVDSTVALVLLKKAIGPERIYALHIDTGLMRKDESKNVIALFIENGLDVHFLDAGEKFLDSLKGVTDPEKKRKIIGELFVRIVNTHLKSLSLDVKEWILGQGTIYPDTIETAATKHAAKIKTHHNRVESIRQMIAEGLVVEPISELYKDEVRELGGKLGLPRSLVWRHPFPGPGLGIRIICSSKSSVKTNKVLERRLREEAARFGYKAHLMPVKSVGVQGDARSYKHAAILEGETDWDRLEKVSTHLTNTLSGINRVVCCLQPESIKRISLKKGFLTPERISLLQEVDDFVMDEVKKRKLYSEIWQFPVVLLPVSVNGRGKDSIVLRPVSSTEAMTADFSRPDPAFARHLAHTITAKHGISAVFYDITHKPPATIEWE
jgi:GMP synthase (glutamine-hydrolysing)